MSAREECNEACKRESRSLAEMTTNGNDPSGSNMDLGPYQGEGKGPPGCRWRLVETSHNLEYASGPINCKGELVGLPSSFQSHYSYDGYMELQIICD